MDFLPRRLTHADPLDADNLTTINEPQPSTSRSGLKRTTRPNDNEESCSLIVIEPPAKRHLSVKEVRGMWNLVKVYRQLGTREQAIAFAEDRGMIPREKICSYHKKPMSVLYSSNKTVGSFQCTKGKCREKCNKISRANGTFFENIRLSLPQVFYLMYAYAENLSYNTTKKEDFSEGEHCLSSATIVNWFNYCREAVVSSQTNTQMIAGKMGGPGKVVQVDESVFGERKYKGQQNEGQWIVGMIEDGKENLRLEICPDNVRSPEILVPLIKKHVADGTTIHTDIRRAAYDCLGEHGFVHKKVNIDSEHFFVAEGNTQRIEEAQWRFIKQWSEVKRYFTKEHYNNRININGFIMEYLWRRDLKRNNRDPFEEVINAINYYFHHHPQLNFTHCWV